MPPPLSIVVTVIDLYAFGPRSGPRPPRVGIDLNPDPSGRVGPEGPPFPAGASLFADPVQASLGGPYHRLPGNTPLPVGLGIVADGVDVHPNSPHPATHHTLYPVHGMAAAQFLTLFLALPWQYAGKKS